MKEFSESIFPVMKERGFSHVHVTVCATVSFKSLRACVCVFKFFSQEQISLSTIFAFPAKSLMPWDIYLLLFLYCQLSGMWNVEHFWTVSEIHLNRWVGNYCSHQVSVLGLLLSAV